MKGVFVQKNDTKIEVRIVKKINEGQTMLQYFDLFLEQRDCAQIVLKEIQQFEVVCQKSEGVNNFYKSKIEVLKLGFLDQCGKTQDGLVIVSDLK